MNHVVGEPSFVPPIVSKLVGLINHFKYFNPVHEGTTFPAVEVSVNEITSFLQIVSGENLNPTKGLRLTVILPKLAGVNPHAF